MENLKFKKVGGARSPAERDALLGAERRRDLYFNLEPLGGHRNQTAAPFCSRIGTDNREEMRDQVVTRGTPQSSVWSSGPGRENEGKGAD